MKKIFILIFFLTYISLLPKFSLAYDPNTTHAGITEQVIEFYNLNNLNIISSLDKELIIQGAIDEDNPKGRVLNHFYDPVRGIGINDYQNAVDWIVEDNRGNDFSWPKSIIKYAEGDKEGALVGLGHILHVIEDMTVPDHTRNDPHIGDGSGGLYTGRSLYEDWAKENMNRGAMLGIAHYYNTLGYKTRHLGFIADYLRDISAYSNNNYVSPDTIENNVYQYSGPIVIKKIDGYVYGKDSYFYDEYKLYIEEYSDRYGLRKIMVNEETSDYSVLEEYFTRLSKMAILSGAGVTELFFMEAENARREYIQVKIEEQKITDDYEKKKTERLASSGFFGKIWYTFGYALTETASTFASAILTTVNFFNFAFYNGGSLALNATRNIRSSLGFTANTLATIGVQKVEDNVEKAKKVIVSTGQKVVLYVKENTSKLSDLVTPALAYTPPSPPTSPNLTTEELVKLMQILNEIKSDNPPTDGEFVVQPIIKKTGSSGHSTLPDEPQLLVTATTTTLVSLATTTIIYEPVMSPIVLSAENILNSTPTTTILFSGTSTADFIISNDLNLFSVSVTPEGNWSMEITDVLQGTTTINFFAEPDLAHASTTSFDAETNITLITYYTKSEPTEVDIFVGEVDSPIDISVLEPEQCLESLLSDSCLITSTELALSWSSNSSELDYFTIVINDEPFDTTETSSILILEDEMENTVEVFATDINGEISDSIIYQIIVYIRPVVINEIAWMGTGVSFNDEWLELFNVTPYDLDLTGWKLTSAGGLDISLESIIEAEGYYLLERTDDTTVNDITADQIYTGVLNNDGEVLTLSSPFESVDETPEISTGKWPAGDNIDKRTMERRKTYQAGDFVNNWQSYLYDLCNTDGCINGTPRAENSKFIPVLM